MIPSRCFSCSAFFSCTLVLSLIFLTAFHVDAAPVNPGTPSPAADQNPANGLAGDARQKGMTAYEEEDYETALLYLREAHALNPEDAEVAGRYGFAAKETGAYEAALSALETAVRLRPDEYYYWWWLSDTQRLLGAYTDALKSMERARDVAPADIRQELQEYVAYTSILLDSTPSWENFDQHMDFAERHRKQRRVRRQIEEYVNALDVAPPPEPDNLEGLGRLAWVNQQLGIQYIYIEEPDPAIDYLKQAIEYTRQANVPQEVMRQEQFIAIAYRLKADREPHEEHRHFENAVKHWQRTLDLAIETEDVPYQRYSRGRLLDTLVRFLPLDDPLLTEIRAINLKEVPWQGPVNDFSTAEAVFGEAKCRLTEGDYAGARILYEMTSSYFEESQYLSDYQRATELYLDLARTYFEQGHFEEALTVAAKAAEKAAEARQYVDADAFNRSSGEHTLRHIAAARARAHIAMNEPALAFAVIESYNAQMLLNLLGARILDDAARTDAASEKSVIRRRIPMLESRLALEQDMEETERLQQRLAADKARMQWLEKDLSFLSPQKLNFRPLPAADAESLQQTLGEETLLAAYLFDKWGGTAVLVSRNEIKSALLDLGEKDLFLARNALQVDSERTAALAQIALLSEKMVAPLAPMLSGQTLIIMADENSRGLPFNLLFSGTTSPEAPLSILYTNTASRVVSQAKADTAAPERLRYAVGRETMDSSPCQATTFAVPPVCLRSDDLTVAHIISDVQQNEMVHLGCILDQTPPDALLCELHFGTGKDDTELPLARLLGMKIPAALVTLDWVDASGTSGLRSAVGVATTELLHYAGASSILMVSPEVPEAVRAVFFQQFYAETPSRGQLGAFESAKAAVHSAYPESLFDTGFSLFGDNR